MSRPHCESAFSFRFCIITPSRVGRLGRVSSGGGEGLDRRDELLLEEGELRLRHLAELLVQELSGGVEVVIRDRLGEPDVEFRPMMANDLEQLLLVARIVGVDGNVFHQFQDFLQHGFSPEARTSFSRRPIAKLGRCDGCGARCVMRGV